MYTTSDMLLTSWDLSIDDFDHTQLDGNWKQIDTHDHTSGNGRQIPTAGIQLKAITTALLNDLAVTTDQLASTAVTTDKLADAAVTSDKLENAAVITDKIAPGAVTADKLDPSVLPLGSVIMWWRGQGSGATPPGGWEIMDGRPWNVVPNLLGMTTGNLPNMVGSFARGTDIDHVGGTGGADTTDLTHTHVGGSHSHAIAEHEHAIASGGAHTHSFEGGLKLGTRTNCFDIGAEMQNRDGHWWQNTFYSVYVQNLLSLPEWNGLTWGHPTPAHQKVDGTIDMDSAGGHNHGGLTGTSGVLTTLPAEGVTQPSLGNTTVVPKYIGLVYIMRCR